MAKRGLNRDALTLDQRCTAIARSGEQCRNPHATGVDHCRAHMNGANEIQKAAQVRVINTMRKMRVLPIGADDALMADPAATLQQQIRDTWGWIHYCEERITELADDDELVYGKTSEVEEEGTRDGADLSVRATTHSAKTHEWIIRLEWNRRHLAQLTKLWIDAGFEAAKLRLEERLVDRLESAIDAIVSDLGLNPRDPDVRRTVRRRMNDLASINA